jgi:hypothetical protein
MLLHDLQPSEKDQPFAHVTFFLARYTFISINPKKLGLVLYDFLSLEEVGPKQAV